MMIYWSILLAANIPLFLLIGWLVFDTTDNAAESFIDTVWNLVLVALLGPFRRLFGDEDQATSLFSVGIFFVVCAAILYGEIHLLTQWLGSR